MNTYVKKIKLKTYSNSKCIIHATIKRENKTSIEVTLEDSKLLFEKLLADKKRSGEYSFSTPFNNKKKSYDNAKLYKNGDSIIIKKSSILSKKDNLA